MLSTHRQQLSGNSLDNFANYGGAIISDNFVTSDQLRNGRDTQCLDRDNWCNALELLGGESEDVEIHRFGHWACGWYEQIYVRKESPAYAALVAIEATLDDYCILDEDSYMQRKSDVMAKYWNEIGMSERIRYCADAGISIFAAREDYPPERESGENVLEPWEG